MDGSSMQQQIPNTNIRGVLIAGFLLIGLGFGGFLLWAITAPLGKGIVAEGVVSVETNRKAVQHLYGGIVEEILVRENQLVQKGELLIRLADSRPRAEYTTARYELISVQVQYARLLAERGGLPDVIFPLEVLSSDDTEVVELVQTQRELFERRRKSLQNEQQIILENIEAQQKYIESLGDVLASRDRQIMLLKEELAGLRELAKDGHYPRNSLLNQERALEEIISRRSEDLAAIARTQSSITELRLSLVKLEQDFHHDVEAQISDAQRRLGSLREQYHAAKDILQRTDVLAPESGIVLSLSAHTIGGVVRAGETVMEIVPVHAELIVEAKISPQDIDRVHRDMQADLRFSAFDARNTPVIEGEVIAVSPDRLIDEQTRMPYYLSKIAISPEELQKLGANNRLVPGLPAEVVIKTGERTLLQYLIDPFLDRLFVSFKEE